MKPALVLAALIALLFVPRAHAEKIPNAEGPPLVGTPTCPIDEYKTEGEKYDPSLKILDLGKLVLGPVKFESDCPGEEIADVVVDVFIDHDWIGDLVVDLFYDEDCDGDYDVGPVRLVCRQGSPGCGEAGYGCSGDLYYGPYTWSDAAGEELAVPACTGVLTPGCYKPSSAGPPLSTFEGRKKDGCWFLEVSDHADADDGLLYAWYVHLLNRCEPTGSEPATWGALKRIYR